MEAPFYSYNWNQEFIGFVRAHNIKNINMCLEIGSFEGLTSNYICDNILSPTGKLICIDPLEDRYLTTDLTEEEIIENKTGWSYFIGQYDRFIKNIESNKDKIELMRCTSDEAFKLMPLNLMFDLIYIDGDHRHFSVYKDAINSFSHLNIDGIIIFDDYHDSNGTTTKTGIDKFLEEYEPYYTLMSKGYQVIIKKISNDKII